MTKESSCVLGVKVSTYQKYVIIFRNTHIFSRPNLRGGSKGVVFLLLVSQPTQLPKCVIVSKPLLHD
jgi:hypothetical protein